VEGPWTLPPLKGEKKGLKGERRGAGVWGSKGGLV